MMEEHNQEVKEQYDEVMDVEDPAQKDFFVHMYQGACVVACECNPCVLTVLILYVECVVVVVAAF